MKKLLFLILFVLPVVAGAQQVQTPAPAAAARTGSISGQILDNASSEALSSANIAFRSVGDTTFVRRATSMPDGKFTVRDLPYGAYNVEVTYIGHETYRNRVSVNSRSLTVAPFYLVSKDIEAETVSVNGQMVRVSMHGDTIVYNAKAFKAAEDADAEAIVKQLPGVEVQGGAVKVQGKNVQKILVDNKETYGTDVAQTMKTIPANMLEKVEVYEKLSDFAETTGINDGDDYTVMNFVTGIKVAYFGDMAAMYGHKDMYAAGAQWNVVTGGHRLGLHGGVNNTGSSGAYGNDMSGMFGGGGFSSRYSGSAGQSANNKTRNANGGLTYNYEPSEKFRFNTNYRYGHSDNESKGAQETRYFGQQYPYDLQYYNSLRSSIGNNHNFGMSSRWRVDARQTLNMRASATASGSNSNSWSDTKYFDEAVAELVRRQIYDGKSGSDSYSANVQVNYGLKLSDNGRSVRVGVNGSLSKRDGDDFMENYIYLLNPAQDSLGRARSLDDSKSRSVSARVEYFEPITQYLRFVMNYSARYSYSNNADLAERKVYANLLADTDEEMRAKLDAAPWSEWNTGSSRGTQHTTVHGVGPGLNYRKNNDELQLQVNYQHTGLHGERVLPAPSWKDRKGFNSIAYTVNYRKQFSPQKRFSATFSSDTNTPGLSQLQPVDTESTSGLYVSGGNDKLKPYYSYRGEMGYNIYNIRTSTSFSVNLWGSVTTNSMGTDRYLVSVDEGAWTTPNGTVLKPGVEYSRTINIDRGSWSMGLYTNYGRPIKAIKSNLNINLNGSLSESPGRVNGKDNTARNQSVSLGVNLYSNFSEKLTFSMNINAGPTKTDNTNKEYNDVWAFSHMYGFDFYWRTWKDFVLRGNLNYSYSKSHQDNFAKDYVSERLYSNFALGKKVFKNKRGEVTLAVNNIFDQRQNYGQSNMVDRITYTQDTGLGRYYSVSLRYQLRNFSKEDVRRGGPRAAGAGGSGGARPPMR